MICVSSTCIFFVIGPRLRLVDVGFRRQFRRGAGFELVLPVQLGPLLPLHLSKLNSWPPIRHFRRKNFRPGFRQTAALK